MIGEIQYPETWIRCPIDYFSSIFSILKVDFIDLTEIYG